MLKVVAISDTHTLHKQIKLPKGNVLIHAGDACSWGTYQEFADFADWFKMQPYEHKVFVAGNHDRFVETNRRDAIEILGDTISYLQDTSIVIGGWVIYGSPWVPAFCNWAFNADERQLEAAAQAIPDNVDILVTHTPPYGLLDDGLRFGYKHTHIGSLPLKQRIDELFVLGKAPKYHIFGHNHCGYGVTNNGMVSANVAQCNERYNIVNPPVTFVLP